jgi:WD40 repeat protein
MVQTVDINCDHTIIVTGGLDKTTIVWVYNSTTNNYDNQTLTDIKGIVSVVRINNNGSVVLVGGNDTAVYIYTLNGTTYRLQPGSSTNH